MGRNKIRALFRELPRGGVEDELAGKGGGRAVPKRGRGSRLSPRLAGPEPDSRLGDGENKMNSEAISETD